MKSLKMNKVLGSIRKATSGSNGAGSVSNDPQGDGPEAVAARNVRSFCESGGPNSDDEILFLPPIVDAAESSPAAAAECARILRQYLKKDYSSKPSHQYNATMLIRILADNPGPTFTRNLDDKFVKTAKELLKSNDPSVRQILMETLDAFENTKAYDEGLAPLIAMWKQEKKDAQKRHGGRGSQHQQAPVQHPTNAPPVAPHSQNYFARSRSGRRLPEPVELASRLEEAKTSASLLHQVVSSTPPSEMLHNDLIKEFADRCSSASRSIQGYMSATDPAPDNDTMETLINTNEQLQASLNLHQRALLNARKQASIDAWSADVATSNDGEQRQAATAGDPYANNGSAAPALPSRSAKPPASNGNGNDKGKAREYEPATAGPSRTHTPASLQQAAADREKDNPFRDPEPEQQQQPSGSRSAAEPRLALEPFHPGFGTTTGAGPRDSDSDVYDAEAAKRQEPMYRY